MKREDAGGRGLWPSNWGDKASQEVLSADICVVGAPVSNDARWRDARAGTVGCFWGAFPPAAARLSRYELSQKCGFSPQRVTVANREKSTAAKRLAKGNLGFPDSLKF